MIFLLTRFYKPLSLLAGGSLELNKRKSSKTERMAKFIAGVNIHDDEYYV